MILIARHLNSMCVVIALEKSALTQFIQVPVGSCDYLVDLDFPRHPSTSPLEPRYAIDSRTWERAVCVPFLDASHSSLLTRTLWMPGEAWQSLNEYGDYCLLRNKARISKKEKQVLKSMIRQV